MLLIGQLRRQLFISVQFKIVIWEWKILSTVMDVARELTMYTIPFYDNMIYMEHITLDKKRSCLNATVLV